VFRIKTPFFLQFFGENFLSQFYRFGRFYQWQWLGFSCEEVCAAKVVLGPNLKAAPAVTYDMVSYYRKAMCKFVRSIIFCSIIFSSKFAIFVKHKKVK
jgi:hypothetical protein